MNLFVAATTRRRRPLLHQLACPHTWCVCSPLCTACCRGCNPAAGIVRVCSRLHTAGCTGAATLLQGLWGRSASITGPVLLRGRACLEGNASQPVCVDGCRRNVCMPTGTYQAPIRSCQRPHMHGPALTHTNCALMSVICRKQNSCVQQQGVGVLCHELTDTCCVAAAAVAG
jgi:hypothetical protein